MTRTSIIRLGICDRTAALASPVARAFVRICVERRGCAPAEAEQIYIDYLRRAKPADERRQRKAA